MGPLVNEIIRAFKNTSVLTVIGLFDLLGGAMTALSDPLWAPYHVETYLFVFALYFCFCWPMSKYSQQFESDKTQQRGKQ
jgi:general L-amino acid transport system permease protein